jgi:heat shock protein HslJ
MGVQEIPAPAGNRRPSSPGRHPGPGSRPTIRFTAEPTSEGAVHPPGMRSASGWSFCNGYGTAYALGPGDALRFHGFQSTLVGCDGPDSLETRFFRGLHETRRIVIDSARLALVAENGSRLTFVLVANSVDSAVR